MSQQENWLPNSSDQNSVYFSVGGGLQQTVYRHKISYIDIMIVIKARGAHIEFRQD